MKKREEERLKNLIEEIEYDYEYYFTDKYDEPQCPHVFPVYRIDESFGKVFEILVLLYKKLKRLEEEMEKLKKQRRKDASK